MHHSECSCYCSSNLSEMAPKGCIQRRETLECHLELEGRGVHLQNRRNKNGVLNLTFRVSKTMPEAKWMLWHAAA